MSLRHELTRAMKRAGDGGPILHATISDELLDSDNEYIAMAQTSGLSDEERAERWGMDNAREGCGATLWTERYVYFPLCYDGGIWFGFAPRNPCEHKVPPLGGGGW